MGRAALRAEAGAARREPDPDRPGSGRVLSEGRRRWRPPRIELLVTSRGGAGWLVGRTVYTTRGIGRSSLASGLRTARGPLVLEEDRTVRWHEPGGLLGFEDLHGAPCGPRTGYRVVAEDGGMLLTDAVYDGDLRVVRACLRGAARDRVILQLRAERPELVGLDAPWALFSRRASDGCAVELYHADFDSARVQPVACERAPTPETPFAVMSRGAPAWILEGRGRSVLVLAVGGRLLELDAAGPGGIAALASEGDELRWLHDGEPRSVVFHP
jgi:hypothetical protein